MKKAKMILSCLMILTSVIVSAQTKTGYDFFSGKWNVVAAGPYGDVKMVLTIEKKGDVVISSLNNEDGSILYKVNKTSVNEKYATISFEGSQGPVEMVISKRDEDHVSGDIMGGVASVSGERIKEKK